MNRRAIVTGADGFLGAHLVRRLVAEGYLVGAITRRIGSNDSDRTVLRLPMSPDGIPTREIVNFRPDVMFHLAWSGLRNRNQDARDQLVENLSLTNGLLEAATKSGCRSWIGLGSQEEYGLHEGELTEESPTEPRTPYGRAKLACGTFARESCFANGIEYLWIRLFAAYGPGDRPERFLPSLILTMLRGNAPDMTEGNQYRDYLYVTDVAEAILRAHSASATGVLNVASGVSMPLIQFATMARDMIDPSLVLRRGTIAYRDGKPDSYRADIGNLLKSTAWRPSTSLEDGLRLTINWFKARA